jgi:hypothetical protein
MEVYACASTITGTRVAFVCITFTEESRDALASLGCEDGIVLGRCEAASTTHVWQVMLVHLLLQPIFSQNSVFFAHTVRHNTYQT